MATRASGCWSALLMLPSALIYVVRRAFWVASFPRPHKLHTVQEAMDIVRALDSEHGGTVDAFPYVQRILELDPLNINANKFMASWFMTSRKFAEALSYLRVAVRGAHPDSVYIVMLNQALATLGKDNNAWDAREER